MTAHDSSDSIDLATVESVIAKAIQTGDTSQLNLLGHGEVSIVLGWPTDGPTWAVKRVPPFRSDHMARQYVGVCGNFFSALSSAGVAAWPTTLRTLARADGRSVVYHCQPVADPLTIGATVLRAAAPADQHPLIDAIVHAAGAVVTSTIGLDSQASNWVWDGTTASQIDFTSPFMLNEARDDLLFDTGTFLQEYPAALRPYLRRQLLTIIHRFTTPEGALGDMVAMLIKEHLDQWIEPTIRSAKRQLDVTLSRERSQEMLNEDLNIFPMILRLKKSERWWRTHTGRTYEALLPTKTTYEQ